MAPLGEHMEAEHPLPSLGDELEEVYLLLGVGSLVLRRPGPLHQLFEGEVGILRGSSHKGGELHRLLPQFRRHRPPLRRPKCGAEGGRARVSTAGLESGRRGCKAKEGEIEFAAPIDVFWRSRAEEATKYSVQRPERERERIRDPHGEKGRLFGACGFGLTTNRNGGKGWLVHM